MVYAYTMVYLGVLKVRRLYSVDIPSHCAPTTQSIQKSVTLKISHNYTASLTISKKRKSSQKKFLTLYVDNLVKLQNL